VDNANARNELFSGVIVTVTGMLKIPLKATPPLPPSLLNSTSRPSSYSFSLVKYVETRSSRQSWCFELSLLVLRFIWECQLVIKLFLQMRTATYD
jgi:hypothetical protein